MARAKPLDGGRRLAFSCSFATELEVDESVAVDGVCLTVVAARGDVFEAIAVEETLARSTLGAWSAGDRVNLERAVRAGGRLDGHVVQGHVDGTGEVVAVDVLADSRVVRVAYPPAQAALLVEKGSITVDGVSLTVSHLDDPPGTFEVAIIPHTLERTTAASWKAGDRVNLEFDVLGKYALRAGRLRADKAAGAGRATTDD